MTNNIRIQRAIKNITQDQLTEALGITRHSVYSLETNRYQPALLLACRIAFYFVKNINEIFISETADVADIIKAKEKKLKLSQSE